MKLVVQPANEKISLVFYFAEGEDYIIMSINIIPKMFRVPKDMKIIYFYRYISLIITSIFYVTGNKTSTLRIKLFMIICLTISAIIFNYLYSLSYSTFIKKYIIVFIIIEVIGNTVILIPTGGINSPYMWYSLNSILITVYFYNIYVSFLVLAIYQMCTSALSLLLFHNDDNSLIQVLMNNKNLFLSFILITITVQLFLTQAKTLSSKSEALEISNGQLTAANESLKESMEQIIALYQTVHSFTNLDSRDKLINIILHYTKEITKSSLVFLAVPSEESLWTLKTKDDMSSHFKNAILKKVEDEWGKIRYNDLPISFLIDNRKLTVINVSSNIKFYGFLGIENVKHISDVLYKQKTSQLSFIKSLSSIVLERFDLEEVKQQLLINQEQNRIANEIHDNVSQRLFALSCGIFKVIKHTQGIVSEEVREELINIKDSLNDSIKQLRETIYGMSWNKNGVSILQKTIRKYISDISKLYNINILFNVSGSEELIEPAVKKCIYRIICEAVSNAARHGNCSNIDVDLIIGNDCTKLNINDNGSGFNLENAFIDKNSGIGIKNIYNLVSSLNGQIKMNSDLGKGTSININLPNNKSNKFQGAAI